MRPVFIIGCHRSGTTLLGAMIGGHPDIICMPESSYLTDILPDGEDGPHIDPAKVIDRMEANWWFRRMGFGFEGARPLRDQTGPGFRAALEWYVASYGAAHDNPDPDIWVEHCPAHTRYVSTLLNFFPDASFVHIVRDGRAVAASIMPFDWGPHDIIGAARYWLQMVGHARAAMNIIPDGRYLELRYEDLMSNPKAIMDRISSFIGVDYAPSMLKSSGLDLPSFSEYQHGLIGSPLESSRVDAWRESLSQRQIEIFEAETGDMLCNFGYQRITHNKGVPVSVWEKMVITMGSNTARFLRALKFWATNLKFRI